MPDPNHNNYPKANVLVVDDEREHAQVMCEALTRLGHKCDVTYSLAEARGRLDRKNYDVVVTDLMMDGRKDGLAVLEAAKETHPAPPVVLVTAHADIPTCKQALHDGAYDFIEKPLDLEYFRAQVNRAAEKSALERQNEVLQAQIMEAAGFEGIVGKSGAMQRAVTTARQVATSDIPVLVTGESGTGKELIARAIHNNSKRRKQRLVALNCAGLSESILEDELFGHVRGAFTGAHGERAGRFEHADRGTLFMDEIGDMPPAMQAKLLRVLESGEVVRVGSNEPIRVDVRLIAATNKDLAGAVRESRFREDLYFRLRVVTIDLPPLRERLTDLPPLADHFLALAAERHGKPGRSLSREALDLLMAYRWPGNVRELKNVVEAMVLMSRGPVLGPETVPSYVHRPTDRSDPLKSLSGIALEEVERRLVANTLRDVG